MVDRREKVNNIYHRLVLYEYTSYTIGQLTTKNSYMSVLPVRGWLWKQEKEKKKKRKNHVM